MATYGASRPAAGQRHLRAAGVATVVISSSADGGVRTITLDRPAKRNAVTSEGLAELRAAVDAATEPVICLEGAGEAFCAGADLDEVAALTDGDAARAFARRGQWAARALATYDGAVVAGIDGPARGGGVELALACDLRVCTERATFAEPGVALGLFGAWGGTARLPAAVGPSAAADLSLTGRTIDATAARRLGLVSRIVEDPSTVAHGVADNDERAVSALARLLRSRADPKRIAAQERRERAAFAALVTAGRPIRNS